MSFKTVFLNLLFPPRCLLCDQATETHGALCPDCFSSLVFLRPPFCPSCGRPVKVSGFETCPACIDAGLPFEKIRSAVVYDDVSRGLIFSLKYGSRMDAGALMARLMVRAGDDVFDGVDVLVPVPLHRRRLLSRRFNQAVILADGIARETGVKADAFLIKRIRNTKKQGHFSKEKRAENVKGAFEVVSKEKITGKTVLIIDDVMTTGATLMECARVLKKAGVKEIRVLTFARVLE